MQLNTTSLAAACLLWIGTLAGAYFAGKSSRSVTDAAANPSTSDTAATPGGAGNSRATGKAGAAGGTNDAADKPLTIKQLISKAKAMMRNGSMQNPSAMMKVMGLLDKIRPEDVQQALAEAESITEPQQKAMIYMALLGKWAESDGPAAMQFAEEHTKSLGMMSQIGKMSVAAAWAEKDPEAVWQWYKKQSDKDSGGPLGGGSMVLMSLFSNLAANDPDTAFNRLEEIDGPSRQMAMAGMFQSAMFDDEKRQQLLKKVDALPEEHERKQAKQMMLSQWVMLAPEEALTWVKTQPVADQHELRDTVGSMLMMSDPRKGASFLLEGATDEEKSKRYSSIIGQWANLDTNAAGTWLREQPPGPHLDAAKQTFVQTAAQKDPESALAWAGTITNPETREASTQTAYTLWKKKDPAAAEQALNNSGLSEEQLARIRNASSATPTPAPGLLQRTAQ